MQMLMQNIYTFTSNTIQIIKINFIQIPSVYILTQTHSLPVNFVNLGNIYRLFIKIRPERQTSDKLANFQNATLLN